MNGNLLALSSVAVLAAGSLVLPRVGSRAADASVTAIAWQDIPPEALADSSTFNRYLAHRLTEDQRKVLNAELRHDIQAWETATYGGKLHAWHGAPHDRIDAIRARGFALGPGARTTFGLFGPEDVTVKNHAIFLSFYENVARAFGRNRDPHGQGGTLEVYVDVRDVLDLGAPLPPSLKTAALRVLGTRSIPKTRLHQLLDDGDFVCTVRSFGYDAVRFREDTSTLRALGVDPARAGDTLAVFDPKKIVVRQSMWVALGSPSSAESLLYYARSKQIDRVRGSLVRADAPGSRNRTARMKMLSEAGSLARRRTALTNDIVDRQGGIEVAGVYLSGTPSLELVRTIRRLAPAVRRAMREAGRSRDSCDANAEAWTKLLTEAGWPAWQVVDGIATVAEPISDDNDGNFRDSFGHDWCVVADLGISGEHDGEDVIVDGSWAQFQGQVPSYDKKGWL